MCPRPAAEIDPRDNASPYGTLAFFSWHQDWSDHQYRDLKEVQEDAERLQQAGVAWVRMDFLWSDLEPEEGRFDFLRYDAVVDSLRKSGLSILGVLHYNPEWRGVEWNQAPDPDAYERYVRATVRHFKDRIAYWEPWNEPDQITYWAPQDQLVAYAALLKRIAPAIREEDPTAKIVMGGLSRDWPFHVRELYGKAGKDSFDVVNIHPFVEPLHPNAETTLRAIYISVRQVMEEFQDGQKPLWATELGCPGVDKPTDKTGRWWLGTAPTEAQQAAWVQKAYAVSLANGATKVFWAFWRDAHHFKDGVDYFGLVRWDGSLKPGYETLRVLTQAPSAASESRLDASTAPSSVRDSDSSPSAPSHKR